MKAILLFVTLISLSFTAQTHRFIYEYQFKMDSSAAESRKASMVLDVNPNDVKFYNYDFVVTDSTNKTKGQNSIIWDDTPALIRKKNSNINSNYNHVQNMFIVDTEDQVDWKLSEETKNF